MCVSGPCRAEYSKYDAHTAFRDDFRFRERTASRSVGDIDDISTSGLNAPDNTTRSIAHTNRATSDPLFTVFSRLALPPSLVTATGPLLTNFAIRSSWSSFRYVSQAPGPDPRLTAVATTRYTNYTQYITDGLRVQREVTTSLRDVDADDVSFGSVATERRLAVIWKLARERNELRCERN